MSEPAVEVNGVMKRFGDSVVLHPVDFAVEPGEFVSILGPSGCGKTTLLRIISGFETPTTGTVRIQGEDVTDIPPHRRPTNIVFQRGALFPHMNVFENVAYSLKLRGVPKKEIAERVDEVLHLVKLDGLGSRGPTQLSGGQIQRVALARALAARPTVLLLDEPLSALDLKLRQHMQLELRHIQRDLGATFIYVTHDQTEALVMSDRIAVMNEGRVVQVGTPREVYARPATVFASDFIGETNLVRGAVASAEASVVALDIGVPGRVAGGAGELIAVGTQAVLSVRPESLRVRAPGGAPAAQDTSSLRGQVEDVIFLGSHVRLSVRVTDAVELLVDLRDDDSREFERGATVVVEWPDTSATVWGAS